ncbi:MAG TPA: gamma-glutamyl-gamma-aminobutyrate hydrolase family protein [Candidatus Eisenbacteria bacterium]|nr:gamma-glutamyl-gamma-aminobutyrate hydrolase family protein [Candidatus Eisenbacteria bacterium]
MASTVPNRPRIGIPWRTSEEGQGSSQPWQGKIRYYAEAVERAGAEPVELALNNPVRLQALLSDLDGFVLPGSPADVDPREYGRQNRGKSAPADVAREQTDRSILEHAFAERKPVLAICYGCQILNVYLGGTLIQDLHSEIGTSLAHRKKDLTPEPEDDPRHAAQFELGSRLAVLAGSGSAVVNSSHHQSIEQPGQNLRITARSPDGIVEGVEWTGDSNWVTGVQWHPERMPGDPLAEKLFRELAASARSVRHAPAAER